MAQKKVMIKEVSESIQRDVVELKRNRGYATVKNPQELGSNEQREKPQRE